MGNTIAMILGNERSRTTPDFIRGSRVRRREEFEAAENGRDMAVKREVRAIMAAIDKELGNYQSLAELDFRAAAGAAILILAALGVLAYAVIARAWNDFFD